ncbi:MAG TPA: rhodanese-like domain-containing protein [Actinomycetota bacterium]|nr:rhodanese-like domain-containing protein [Actinomycetota bacterium]
MSEIRRIERDELRTRIDAGDVTVVEALGPEYFEDAHLPGARNLPHDRVDELAPSVLPDKDAPVVVYCSNLACQNSAIAARRLVQLGYTQVYEYEAGKQDWIDAGLQTERGPVRVA